MLAAIVYHKILDNRTDRTDPFSISVTKATFLSQVTVLAREFPIIDGRTLVDEIDEMILSKQLYILFTFDDGYRNSMAVGAEILADHGLRGVGFVSPWHIDHNEDYWWDVLAATEVENITFPHRRAHLMSLPYEVASREVVSQPVREYSYTDSIAGWDTLRATSPVLDFACHGYRHDPPSAVPVLQWLRDLRKAKRRFTEEEITPLPIIAYPYGSPDSVTDDHVLVAASEFKLGFVGAHRIAKPSDEALWRWKLPRIFASNRSGEALYSNLMAWVERLESS